MSLNPYNTFPDRYGTTLENAGSASSYLRQRGVKRLVHFTAVENLSSIFRLGLLPRSELERRQVAFHSNDSIRYDGEDHVNLSISHVNSGMFFKFRRENPTKEFVDVDPNFRTTP